MCSGIGGSSVEVEKRREEEVSDCWMYVSMHVQQQSSQVLSRSSRSEVADCMLVPAM
jgi:hypothetical protein